MPTLDCMLSVCPLAAGGPVDTAETIPVGVHTHGVVPSTRSLLGVAAEPRGSLEWTRMWKAWVQHQAALVSGNPARTLSLLYFQGPDSGDWDPGEYGRACNSPQESMTEGVRKVCVWHQVAFGQPTV